MYMEIIVEHRSEVIDGKEYPVTITRQIGLQEIEVDDRPVLVDKVAIFDSPLGQSRCWSRVRETPATEEERAANRARLQAVAQEVIMRQGLW